MNLFVFLESGQPANPCCNSNGEQTNSWFATNGRTTACGRTSGQYLCDLDAVKHTVNTYFYNAEYNFNISYLGYYDHAYALQPVGWREYGSQVFVFQIFVLSKLRPREVEYTYRRNGHLHLPWVIPVHT
jgi:hypothetical protein